MTHSTPLSPLKTGLIGCGDFSAFLGRYIQEVADITAVCDIRPDAANAVADTLGGGPTVYTDFRKMFTEADLEAVFITAANFVHAEIAIAAAESGLHVFCEKAMARTVEECWAMVHACEKAQVKLMVGHKRRLRPSWSRMIELTADDQLGKPLSATVTQYADMRPYNYPGTWWSDAAFSGGSYAVLGVHVIDWFAAMFGPAQRVSAINGPTIDEDYRYPTIHHATIQFSSGGIASINTSFHYPIHKFREAQGPMVQCEHGGLKLVPQMEHLDLYYQRLNELEPQHERFMIADDFDPAYRREVGDFVQWVRGEIADPCLTWREGLRCVETMQAFYQSADQQGAWVDLPLTPVAAN